MKKGFLLTLEGPDGSGKTTQIELLNKYLKEKGHDTLITREPGGSKISEKIREVILDNDNKEMSPVCEALLYSASRAQLVEEVLKPALMQGKILLCDRFVHSSLVYQGYARNLGVEKIRGINDFALNGIKANLTIMIDIPYEIGLERKRNQKNLDRMENSGDNFHSKVFEGYNKIIKSMDDVKVIDGQKSKEEIHNAIVTLLEEKLNKY